MALSTMKDHELPITQLNDDILVNVLKFLPVVDKFTLKRVCEKWKSLSKVSSMYQKGLAIVPFPKGEVSAFYCVDRKLATEMKITKYDIVGDKYYSLVENDHDYDRENFMKIIQEFPRLECLEILKIDKNVIEILSEKAEKLKFLLFHEVDPNVTKKVLQSNLKLLLRIRKVGFGSLVGDREIRMFIRELPNITELYFTSSNRRDFPPIRLETLLLIGRKIKKIVLADRTLDLSFSASNQNEIKGKIRRSNLMKLQHFESYSVTTQGGYNDELILEMLLNMKRIQTLILNKLIFENDSSLHKINKLIRLKRLEVVNMKNGNDLDIILNKMSQLETLRLEAGAPRAGCDNPLNQWFCLDDVQIIENNCPNLRHLYLKTLQTTKWKRDFSTGYQPFHELKNLEILELPLAEDINDQMFWNIVQACKKVKRFNFQGIKRIDKVDLLFKKLFKFSQKCEEKGRLVEFDLEHLKIPDQDTLDKIDVWMQSLSKYILLCNCNPLI